jgi:hypothetical protein
MNAIKVEKNSILKFKITKKANISIVARKDLKIGDKILLRNVTAKITNFKKDSSIDVVFNELPDCSPITENIKGFRNYYLVNSSEEEIVTYGGKK